MNVSGPIFTSIAAGLVEDGLSFSSTVSRNGNGIDVRLFNVPFSVDEVRRYSVTVYVGGAVIVALTALLLEDESRRLEIGDFISEHNALARLVKRPVPAADQRIVWVEAVVPVPTGAEPMLPELAVAPIRSVSSAVTLLLETFQHVLRPLDATTSLPMMESTTA